MEVKPDYHIPFMNAFSALHYVFVVITLFSMDIYEIILSNFQTSTQLEKSYVKGMWQPCFKHPFFLFSKLDICLYRVFNGCHVFSKQSIPFTKLDCIVSL
jgi:hypothetical protein